MDVTSPAAASPFATLTESEMSVLQLMLGGAVNKEIAKRLDMSLRSVEKRQQKIRDKSGARNRIDVIRMAVQAGIEAAT